MNNSSLLSAVKHFTLSAVGNISRQINIVVTWSEALKERVTVP